MGVSPSKLTVIPNGVDTEMFKPMRNCGEIINRYALEGKKEK